MDKIRKSYNIAARGLRDCYTSEGILAGKRNFVDYWARDGFFASLGSIALGDVDQAKLNLKLFMKHQKGSGHLPYRIISIDQFLKYLHFKKRFKKPLPNYSSYLGDKVVDQNLLFAFPAIDILDFEHDHEYLATVLPHLELAFIWGARQDKDSDGLIEEGYLGNWMDHTKKRGKTLINNVLYYGALKRYIGLSNNLGNCEVSRRYQKKLDKLAEKINEVFWNEDYFIDWVDSEKHHYLDTSGNIFSILFGLSTEEQSRKILDKIRDYKGSSFIPKANYPHYRKRRIQPHLFLAGLADYAGFRIWIGSLYALAWERVGNRDEAISSLKTIAENIVKYNAVYEIYTRNGCPIKRWPAYKNEVPFAWSCGVYIWVLSQIFPEHKEWLQG